VNVNFLCFPFQWHSNVLPSFQNVSLFGKLMYLSKKLIFWNRGNNILQELSLPCCCESNGIIYLRNAALARCFHSSREINKGFKQ
jgi:hypothetical protein